MNISRHVPVLFALGIFMALAGTAAIAEDAGENPDPEYAVEIVIFQYLNPDDGGEGYSSDTRLPDFGGTRSLSSMPDLVPLAPDELALGGEAYTFRRGANYRLLFHAGWHQKLASRKHAEPVYVRYPATGKRSTLATIPGLSFVQPGKDAPVMEGTIQVALERYLHLTVDLVYRPESSSPPATLREDVYIEPDSPYEETQIPDPVYRLAEARRMRSGERHYLDHPQFGVIALIRKYDTSGKANPAGSDRKSAPRPAPGNSPQ